jgi:lysophospholipase L1-like esterase
VLFLLIACAEAVDEGDPVRFLALGDSYTIGQGVDPGERWPSLLAQRLRDEGVVIGDPVIVARTGWTVAELEAGIDQAAPSGPFDLVTLQIGVNDQFRSYEVAGFAEEFAALLDRAIGFAGGDPGRVVVLSIPDWGVTPFASGDDRERIAREIDAFNRVVAEEALRRGVGLVDVTPISRLAGEEPGLVAGDGLHPSREMYSAWVDLVLPVAREVVG